MYQEVYYVDKRTGTFADVFLAYGLAALLDSVLGNFVPGPRWVRLRDQGPHYAVELSHPLTPEWVDQAPFQMLAPYIRTTRDDPQCLTEVPASAVVDYQAQWDRFRQYVQIPEATRAQMPTEQAAQVRPHPHFPIFAWVGERRMQAIGSYNKLILRWHRLAPFFAENLRYILMLFAKPCGDVKWVQKKWRQRMLELGADCEEEATLLQLLNPSQGKGQNKPKANQPKANRLKRDNVCSFWLLEYLKAVGMYHCAVPRRVKGTQDRKTYAIAPLNVRLADNDTVLTAFQDALWENTAVKMDILATLQYTKCFLKHCQTAAEADLAVELFGQGPENFIAGLHVAYYKDLGNASAVMNISFIELPRWMRVQSVNDMTTYLEVLEEHENIIRSIEEERGGYDLLVAYRDFLSGGRWDAFFDFMADYGSLLIRELAQGHYWVKPFTIRNLEELIMKSNQPVIPILETPGFRNLAEAIRRSTIVPQYLGRKESQYDIRYGLGQHLKRKSLYNDEFIQALSEFVYSYNAENARIFEKTGRQYRRNILTSDVEEVARLVDTYGAALVGSLLIAFGYARDPKEQEQKEEDSNEH